MPADIQPGDLISAAYLLDKPARDFQQVRLPGNRARPALRGAIIPVSVKRGTSNSAEGRGPIIFRSIGRGRV